eukprot:SAG31_NODE_2612_length_5380_cov_3.060405_3_plen_591_part_00
MQATPRTNVVRFFPRYIVCNKLQQQIHIGQAEEKGHEVGATSAKVETICSVLPDQYAPFHCSNAGNKKVKLLMLRLSGNAPWSGPFCLDHVQDFPLCLSTASETLNAHVHVEPINGSIFVSVSPCSSEFPVYQVCNNLTDQISVQQLSIEGQSTDAWAVLIGPGESKALGLASPMLPAKFLVTFGASGPKAMVFECDISELGESVVHTTVEGTKIYAAITANGPTRMIALSTTPSSVARQEIPTASATAAKRNILVELAGIGLSVVGWDTEVRTSTRCMEELVYIGLNQATLEIASHTDRTDFQFSLVDIQADWMFEGHQGVRDILVHSRPGTGAAKKPAFHAAAVIRTGVVGNAVYFDALTVLMQTLDVRLDIELLCRCMPFLKTIQNQMGAKSIFATSQKVRQAAAHGLQSDFKVPTQAAKMLYFRVLQIQPIRLDITVHVSDATEGGFSEGLPGISLLEGLCMSFGNLDNAPIRLGGVVLEHSFISLQDLGSRVIQHLKHQAVGQSYKAFGAIDMLGNPVGLVNKLGKGIYFFFYEPIQGVVQGPAGLMKGLAKGTYGIIMLPQLFPNDQLHHNQRVLLIVCLFRST